MGSGASRAKNLWGLGIVEGLGSDKVFTSMQVSAYKVVGMEIFINRPCGWDHRQALFTSMQVSAYKVVGMEIFINRPCGWDHRQALFTSMPVSAYKVVGMEIFINRP